jgi:hypothetical protein
MQFAKDSFFLALQTRLAGLNPARTVTINGATVPAVLAVENLPPAAAGALPNAFYVEWGRAGVVEGNAGNSALMSVECVISYYTLGTVQSMVDRGRVLGQLDGELLGICQPTNTEKMDYTQSPAADLGTRVFWNQPAFNEAVAAGVEDDTTNYQTARAARKVFYAQAFQDGRAARRAELTVFFFSEVTML